MKSEETFIDHDQQISRETGLPLPSFFREEQLLEITIKVEGPRDRVREAMGELKETAENQLEQKEPEELEEEGGE